MQVKLIGNDLFIAKKIELNNYEKKIFKLMLNFKDLYMHELVQALRLPEIFIIQIIENLNQKLIDMKVVQFDNRSKRYRLITKEEIYGSR